MPAEGFSAVEHGLGHSDRVEGHLVRVAADEGVKMTLPDHIPNTHLALLMGEVARDGGSALHWATHMAIFSAYYADGADIGDREVLLGLAKGLEGLDAAAVEAAWVGGLHEERLEVFRHVAEHMGIDATPAAVICNELLIGARPYEVMQAAVDRCVAAPGDTGRGAASDGPKQ